MSLSYTAEHLAWQQRIHRETTSTGRFYLNRSMRSHEGFKHAIPSQHAANPNLLRDTPFHHTIPPHTIISSGSISPSKTGYPVYRLNRSLTVTRHRSVGLRRKPGKTEEASVTKWRESVESVPGMRKSEKGMQTSVSVLKNSLVERKGHSRPRSANPVRIPRPPLFKPDPSPSKPSNEVSDLYPIPLPLQRYISELEQLLQNERRVRPTQRRVQAETELENKYIVTSS